MVLQAWFRQLSSETNPLPQAAPWRCIHELTHAAFQASRRCNGTAEVLPSVSKVPGVWRSLSWCLESVMPWRWHYGLYEIWRQAYQWFGFASRLCSWSRMLAPGKFHVGGFAYTSLPVRLDHLFFTRPFVCNALFLFLLLYFHMYKLQTNLVDVCTQLISLRDEHFLGDTLRCAVFSYVQTPDILWKHLCAPAFYWRKPCHEHTFDLLFFSYVQTPIKLQF